MRRRGRPRPGGTTRPARPAARQGGGAHRRADDQVEQPVAVVAGDDAGAEGERQRENDGEAGVGGGPRPLGKAVQHVHAVQGREKSRVA